MRVFYIFIIILRVVPDNLCEDSSLLACPSEIFCHGPLLHLVQMAKIYTDAKYFVDMKIKTSTESTLSNFKKLQETTNKPSRDQIVSFLKENFEECGTEFEKWDPKDWVPNPKFISYIQDKRFKKWASKLHQIWKTLGRKIKQQVKDNQEQYSMVWVPNPVIVPGGRFREFYYWDSYWIIQGLLLSEMHNTAKGMLENFFFMVMKYGLVPNGGRIYYLKRSQPPLLMPMVKLYFEFTNDKQFLKTNIEAMEKEFDFWMKKRLVSVEVKGKNYKMAVYGEKSKGPRPESYWNDVETAKVFKTEEEKDLFYEELKAAAESGWDFSSRWFILNKTNEGKLTNTKIRKIVPIDLNAILCWNAAILSEFHSILGDSSKAKNYSKIAKEWQTAIDAILWHDDVGVWLDYDLINSMRRDYFSPANIFPLWTGCYNSANKEKIVKSVLNYLKNQQVLFQGGVPTTMKKTYEQWDYPNAWPPLQHVMIRGLNDTGVEEAKEYAFELAKRWVRNNHKTFIATDAMFEKYNAKLVGAHGAGGEYEVQLGFGWTNGIILDLLHRYADTLFFVDKRKNFTTTKPHNIKYVVSSSSTFVSISLVIIIFSTLLYIYVILRTKPD